MQIELISAAPRGEAVYTLVDLRVAFYPFLHSAAGANALAYAIFIAGATLWGYAMFRGRLRSAARDKLVAGPKLSLHIPPHQ